MGVRAKATGQGTTWSAPTRHVVADIVAREGNVMGEAELLRP